MAESRKRLFESDRRMEVKMRIAASKIGATTKEPPLVFRAGDFRPNVIGRLIKRVRRL
jgi:hypothetical protein